MDVLYRDFGAARYQSIDDRMKNPLPLAPAGQIFAPLSTLSGKMAERRYQATPERALSLLWYVPLDIDSERDGCAWANIVVPAGEKLNLYRHLPGWNRLLDVGVNIGCNSDGMTADISIVRVADPETDLFTIASGVDLSSPDDFAYTVKGTEDGNKGAKYGDYIKRSDSYLLKLSITPPYTNADGNGVFVKSPNSPCEVKSCIRIQIHAHLRNMCFKEELQGCGGSGCGNCFEYVPPLDCTDNGGGDDPAPTPTPEP